MAEPVILELAVNGATLRRRNRHVPRTPAEITEAALAGIESGASIVHNHNDEPMFAADGPDATVVTEIDDCSRAPEERRAGMDNGRVWIESMAKTLERLDALCGRQGNQPSPS